MLAIGQHCLVDVYELDGAWAQDACRIETLLRQVAEAADATIINSHFHTFGNGGGVTGVLLLAESHISIHTWPEHVYGAIDIFMCGHHRIEAALTLLRAQLPAAHTHCTIHSRGMPVHQPALASGGSE